MVHTLEAIKGGGGSIKVGTTGTISSLMSRELESSKYVAFSSTHESCAAATIMAPGAITSPKRPKPGSSDVEASSSSINNTNPELVRNAKHYTRKTQNVAMLDAGNVVCLDATPIRKRTAKKGPPNMVEIVDIRCGHPDRAWATPITNRLRKLSFSKLSDSIN